MGLWWSQPAFGWTRVPGVKNSIFPPISSETKIGGTDAVLSRHPPYERVSRLCLIYDLQGGGDGSLGDAGGRGAYCGADSLVLPIFSKPEHL